MTQIGQNEPFGTGRSPDRDAADVEDHDRDRRPGRTRRRARSRGVGTAGSGRGSGRSARNAASRRHGRRGVGGVQALAEIGRVRRPAAKCSRRSAAARSRSASDARSSWHFGHAPRRLPAAPARMPRRWRCSPTHQARHHGPPALARLSRRRDRRDRLRSRQPGGARRGALPGLRADGLDRAGGADRRGRARPDGRRRAVRRRARRPRGPPADPAGRAGRDAVGAGMLAAMAFTGHPPVGAVFVLAALLAGSGALDTIARSAMVAASPASGCARRSRSSSA